MSGMKLLCSLEVQKLYLLSDGSRVDRLRQGGCCLSVSFGLCADISPYGCHDALQMVPVMFWAV